MDEVMRFVHPRLGVVEIDRLGRAPELTAGLGSWTMSDDAERELRDLWVRVAERLSKAGATVAELDVCGTSPELIQGCPGWERFPRVDGGPWGDQLVTAVAHSAPCWMRVSDASSVDLLLLDGGLDRLIVLAAAVDLDGVA